MHQFLAELYEYCRQRVRGKIRDAGDRTPSGPQGARKGELQRDILELVGNLPDQRSQRVMGAEVLNSGA